MTMGTIGCSSDTQTSSFCTQLTHECRFVGRGLFGRDCAHLEDGPLRLSTCDSCAVPDWVCWHVMFVLPAAKAVELPVCFVHFLARCWLERRGTGSDFASINLGM